MVSRETVVRSGSSDGTRAEQVLVLGGVPGEPANALAAAEDIEAGVGGDAMQPGRDIEVGVRVAEAAVGADEAILRQVVGIIGVAHHAIDEAENLPLVTLDDCFERGLIAGFCPAYPHILFGCHQDPFHHCPPSIFNEREGIWLCGAVAANVPMRRCDFVLSRRVRR